MALWLETDTNANTNISSAAAVGVHTATRDEFVLPQILADQVAGGGDYVYYVTLQVNGTGSAHVIGPKTTHTAAAGETAIGGQGGLIFMRSGDVLTVYIDGLAGDTTAPDVTVRFAAIPLPSAAAGAAGGLPVLDASLVSSANVTYWAGVAAGAMPAKVADLPAAAPTAAAIRTEMDSNSTKLANLDAAVSSRLATSGYTAPLDATATQTAAAAALTAYDPPTKAELDAGLALLATSAALAVVDSNVDAIRVVTDQLDLTAVTQVATSSAGHLTITAALTFNEPVTGLTIPATWVTALWTLKADASKPDTAALVQLRETNPAALTDGLVRLNGAAVASPLTQASGALTVTQASGRIDIYLTDELTALLDDATGLGWDVKFINAAGDSSGSSGTADVVLTETKATA